MEILFNTHATENQSPEEILKDFIDRENKLQELEVDKIVNVFDHISRYLVSTECKIKDLLIKNELGFIIFWLKKSSIKKILTMNFEDYKYLDYPQYSKKNDTLLYARPLGLAVHWIAGNVPVLGVISLFQTLLTKNKSIVKVPAAFKNILSSILIDIKNSPSFKSDIKHDLNILLDSIFVVYVEREDKKSQEFLSKISDIRVAWGGLDAVENISKLPKKINTRDIIFGPKLSLSFISKNSISSESQLITLCQGIADDVFAFNQAGCNAPHNILIEDDFKYSIEDFSKYLSIEFVKKSKKSFVHVDPMLTFNLLVKKFLFQSDISKSLLEGEQNQWNIFLNKSKAIEKLDQPLFSRNVFVSNVSSVERVGALLPSNVQSVGLMVEENIKLDVIKILSDFGVDRFPDIGKMSIYQHPWDGYLPLQQTIKWISTN